MKPRIGSDAIGLNRNRSTPNPRIAVTIIPIAQAMGNGIPNATADAASSAPKTRNSPCAKLTMPVNPNTSVMPTASSA